MIKVPCKITLEGDKDCARNFMGAAQSQLRILEGEMKSQGLEQGTRRTQLNERTRVEVRVCFNLSEVKIYSKPIGVEEEEEEEKLDRLIPRFFAYVVKKDGESGILDTEYYWIYFNKKDNSLDGFVQTEGVKATEISEEFEFYVWKVPGGIRDLMFFKCTEKPVETIKELLEKMREIPHNATSVFTKSFMTYAASDIEKENGRRFAAASHLMVSDYKNVFEPIHWPNCIGNWNPIPIPFYPRPTFCDPTDLTKVGLKLHCPPNRFYCNPDERMMVWYTAKSYNPEIAGQDFVCGVVLNLNTATIQNFMFYPTDGGLGFTPYWAVLKNNNEVPVSMISEVEELTEDELTVTISWEGRPVRIRAFLKTGAMGYEEISSVQHRRWTGTDVGFDKTDFAVLDQTFEGQPSSQSNSAAQGRYDCSSHCGSPEDCDADDRHRREREGTWSYTSDMKDLKKYSKYLITIFGAEFTSISDKVYIQDHEACHTWIQECNYNVDEVCFNRNIVIDKHLYVNMNAENKTEDSIYASWINSNIAFKLRTKSRDYFDGTARFTGYQFGGPDTEDFLDICCWEGGEYWKNYITFFCFHDLAKMPISLWNAMGNENYSSPGSDRILTRESHDDNTGYADVDEYNIDGKITLDSKVVDMLYYLDDRATDDNHGVVAAGKGDSEEVLFGEGHQKVYKPDCWDIRWKMNWNDEDRTLAGCTTLDESIEYIDIKDKLLKALGCEFDELIDIGLV